MAKTTFGNGTVVTPAFLNAIFGQDANHGHVHDGTDADGRCQKIQLPRDVYGVLPVAMYEQWIDGFIQGVTLAINGTDAYDIDVTTGRCKAASDVLMFIVPSYTKQLDATWAAGNNQGGRAAGVSLAGGTEYLVFAIYNPTTGSSDVGFDIAPNAVNLRAGAPGYTAWRKIGVVTFADGTNKITGCCYVTGVDGTGWAGSAKGVTENTFSTEQIVTIGIERRGGIVTLTFPQISGTSDANTFKITPFANLWPSCVTPAAQKILPAFGCHNDTTNQVPVMVQIANTSEGDIELGVMLESSNYDHNLFMTAWATSGTKRLYETTVTYHV